MRARRRWYCLSQTVGAAGHIGHGQPGSQQLIADVHLVPLVGHPHFAQQPPVVAAVSLTGWPHEAHGPASHARTGKRARRRRPPRAPRPPCRREELGSLADTSVPAPPSPWALASPSETSASRSPWPASWRVFARSSPKPRHRSVAHTSIAAPGSAAARGALAAWALPRWTADTGCPRPSQPRRA